MTKATLVLKKTVTWIFVIAAISMMIFTIISATMLDRNNRKIFSYRIFIVESDSMSATDFSAGDLIFIRETDPAGLKEGDIVSYLSTNTDNFGEVVTHKIRAITRNEEGDPGFITYGTTTGKDDEKIVTYPYVLGRYVGRIPKAGYFFEFLKTTPGYIICILLPFSLLILSRSISTVKLFRKYKKEQTEALEKEREKLEIEKAEAAKMMKELLELKAQLATIQAPSAHEPGYQDATKTDNPQEKQ